MADRIVMLVRNTYTHDTRVEKEARTLSDAGFEVTVVADAAPGLPERETRDGSTVIRVERIAAAIPGLRFFLHQARLARVLRRLQPAVLHAHDTNALIPVALAAQALGIPFVYDAHDLWLGRPRRERSRVYFAINQLFYSLVERLFVPRAAATLTVSPPIARHLERKYGIDPEALVPNYPDRPGDLEGRDIRTLKGGERIPANEPIVLYLGGLMAGRGLEQLVDAMALLESAHLVMLGDGFIGEALLRQAAAAGAGHRVHALPPVTPAEVVAYATSATLGVSPIVPSCLNYRYSLPNKLFQYMAAGIPVVASDFPQVRSIVEDAGCGVVVDTTRPQAMADAIQGILEDPGAAIATGERGREAVEKKYNWWRSAEALLDVYATLTS